MASTPASTHDLLARSALRWLGKRAEDLTEAEREVLAGMIERRTITEDLNLNFDRERTLGERLADGVASFGGSWRFLGLFGLFMAVWIVLNSEWMQRPFDPYPYILLNLLLSLLAAVQAPVIMMSQNRQAAKDRADMGNDYQVNLKAEIGIMSLHEKLDRLIAERVDLLLQQQQALHAVVHAAVAPPAAEPGREL
jgi:uncharacterized membrane protein